MTMTNYVRDAYGDYYLYGAEKFARMAAGLHCASRLDDLVPGNGSPFCAACAADYYARVRAEHARWARVIEAGWNMVDPQGEKIQWQ